MTFVVDAPLVLARDQAGRVHHCYAGAVIPWLSDEQRKHFLDLNLVHEVGEVQADEERTVALESGGSKPDSEATKPDLIAWVLANVVKDDESEYSEAELKRLTKDDLWALIDGVEGDPDAGSED
ncbi:hypothetical protein QYF68_26580 [Mycolicibacterium austroafricanum]|uniref:Uncharacterized protein n=1 Tax=Mycolicibacterium austroafricanum TaxID=39687 RepID=A0ABT8HLC7_MYCAO|nr:hypothetical protein [Mycolicibacterium austroafricanum]MDN4521360.1 hypothetical protein [Mycolicibacterium austroafricanum]